MDKRKLENRIMDALDQITPDIFEEIREKDYQRIETEKELFCAEKTARRKRKTWMAAAAVAAAVMLCIFGGSNLMSDPYIGQIYIDVNPGMVLEISSDEQVADINAVNEDAEVIVENVSEKMDFPASVSDTIAVVVGELDAAGYLKKSKGEVLVTYAYVDQKSVRIENELKKAAKCQMKDNTWIYQSFEKDEELEKKASEKKMTPGKYQYIEKNELDVDEHAKKPVREITKSSAVKKEEKASKSSVAEPKKQEAKESVQTKDEPEKSEPSVEQKKQEEPAAAEKKTEQSEKEKVVEKKSFGDVKKAAPAQKVVISNITYSDEMAFVHFKGSVEYDQPSVSISGGASASIVAMDGHSMAVSVSGAKNNDTYILSISGVRGKSEESFSTVSGDFTVKNQEKKKQK